MKSQGKYLLMLALGLCCACAAPQAAVGSEATGSVLQINTRAGVSLPLYAVWRPDAVATLVLFSGGAGGYGRIEADGWPGSRNFLIRSGKAWAAKPFNVVMVGLPSDHLDLHDGAVRIGALHAADNQALLREIKKRSAVPIWLIGTSMGTISAAALAIDDREHLLAGLVLTSSVLAYKIPGALPTQALARIAVPTLIVHHAHDACRLCPPWEIGRLAAALTAAPYKKTIMVDGGAGAAGNSCEALHHHGFIGIEDQVVDLITDWIRTPSS